MELLNIPIPWTDRRTHEPIIIAPIGDIQWAGKRGPTAKELLKEHIARCQELGAWYIGLGDYIDFLSPSNRQRLKAAALYDTSEDVIDDKALDLVLELYEDYLKPTKGRFLGMTHGHHWHQLKTGETTDQRLCQLLGTTFLGTCAYIRLNFIKRHKTEHGPSQAFNVTLFVHHGSGGGQKVTAPLLKLENILPYWDADIMLIGHMTKQAAAPIPRITPRWIGRAAPDLIHRRIYIVGCGGFAKGYTEGAMQGKVPMGSYVEQRMLSPTSLGAPIVKITPRCEFRNPTVHGRRHTRQTWSPDIRVEL